MSETVIDVRAMGAVGDGATDCADAIQAALAAARAQGQRVRFPSAPGRYLLLSPLDIDGLEDVIVEGDGMRASRLYAPGGDVFVGSAKGLRLRNLEITADAGRIFNAGALASLALEGVRLRVNAQDRSVVRASSGCTFAHVADCEIYLTKQHAVPGFDLAGVGVNDNVFERSRIWHAGAPAFRLRASAASAPLYHNTFDHLTFEDCPGGGIVVESGDQTHVLHCHFCDCDLYAGDLVRLGKSAACDAESRDCTIEHTARSAGRMAEGAFDYNLAGSTRMTVRNAAANYPLDGATKIDGRGAQGLQVLDTHNADVLT